MSFLVSFINVGQRFPSSKENFLLFGANCDENHVVVQRYVTYFLRELHHLENNVFDIVTSNSQTIKC